MSPHVVGDLVVRCMFVKSIAELHVIDELCIVWMECRVAQMG